MLAIGFLILTVAVALAIYAGLWKLSSNAFESTVQRKSVRINAAAVLILWLAYIGILSVRGVFSSFSFPPRVPLLLVFPAFAFIVFFFRSGKFNWIVDQTPGRWVVYFQSFRIIVELLLLGLFMNNMVPQEATFDGYNFDVLIGLSAPFVGALAFKGRKVNRPVLYIWNGAGFLTLSVVVFIFMTKAYFPSFWHQNESILNSGFGLFPYTYLAGFLMPVAVFMHVFSIVKTRKTIV